MAYVIHPDGTVKDLDGRVIFFPFEKFRKEICKSGHCFVCGATPSQSFNKEHIFPNWVLRHCNLHNESLTLPNGNRVRYATYSIECCEKCNSDLSDIFEQPVSELVRAGYDGLIDWAQVNGADLVKKWLTLIFLKVHLKDFRNPISLDKRASTNVIGDEYELGELHHIHAVARAATAEIDIDSQVFGTLMILKVDPESGLGAFDYCDNLAGRTMMLQIQGIALIYTLDDCGAVADMLSNQLARLPDQISEIQLREVYARLVAANIHIKNEPLFRTEFSGPNGKPRIAVQLPEFEIHEYEPTIFGKIFCGVLGNLIDRISVDGETGTAAAEAIETGHVSFLFDENGDLKLP